MVGVRAHPESHLVAWLSGTDPGHVAVPSCWERDKAMVFVPPGFLENGQLRLVRSEGKFDYHEDIKFNKYFSYGYFR